MKLLSALCLLGILLTGAVYLLRQKNLHSADYSPAPASPRVENASPAPPSTRRPSATPPLLPSATPRLARAQISNEIYFAAMRQSPGFRGKNDKTDVLAKVPAGDVVQILLSDPQSADGLSWWYVSWGGVSGWMADHTGSGKVILEFVP